MQIKQSKSKSQLRSAYLITKPPKEYIYFHIWSNRSHLYLLAVMSPTYYRRPRSYQPTVTNLMLPKIVCKFLFQPKFSVLSPVLEQIARHRQLSIYSRSKIKKKTSKWNKLRQNTSELPYVPVITHNFYANYDSIHAYQIN